MNEGKKVNLELVFRSDGRVYWFLDYGFADSSGGIFLNSQVYEDEKEAIAALVGMLKWKL